MRLSMLTALVVGLTGCVTVNKEMLRHSQLPSSAAYRGVVEVKNGDLVQKLNNEGTNRGVLSGATLIDAVSTAILKRWKGNDLISDYGSPGSLEKEPDYTLSLSGVRNEDSSIAGAIFSGLTLMLIPTSATLTYDLNAEFINNRTHKKYIVPFKNGVTTYTQILLLPVLPFSWIGSSNMLADMSDYLYAELSKQGAFSP
jgi:hypothetical protein